MKIGKRQRVTDLREIWPTETKFSNWLTTEDGIALLAEDLGVEMEEPQRESRPGDFCCDIVGRLLGDENHVIAIENQFGKTNHDHLGKLLTYAAMHQAMTGVWLAEDISDDHRRVIDWLNDNTPPGVSFYLAQVKAYRIGDSPVAPQLDVVSRPNVEMKLRQSQESRELKARHIWRKGLWEEILSYIMSQGPPFRVQSASTDHWSNIAVGRAHFHISLTLTPKRHSIGCDLYLNPTWKDEAFFQLLGQKEAIEKEIGEQLQWLELPGKKAARILLEADISPADDGNREKVKEWMYRKSLAFYEAFSERVKQLRAPQVEDEGEGEDHTGDE